MSHIAKRLELNSKVRKDGRQLVFMRITKNRKMKRISTGVYVFAKDFEKDSVYGQWVDKRKDPQAKGKNEILKGFYYKLESSAAYFEANRIAPTLNAIANYLTNEEKNSDFFQFAGKHLKYSRETESPNTFKGKERSLKKIQEFVGSTKNLDFRDITVEFLNRYEFHLKSVLGNSTNTTHKELKFIRTLFNAAHREDLIGIEYYPFKKKRLKLAKVEKHKLTELEMKKIIELELPVNSPLDLSRSVFLFSFFACGMRFSDTILIKCKDIKNGRLTYKMRKTQESASVKLPAQAIKILNKLKFTELEPDEYIFPFIKEKNLDKFELQKRISSSNALVNKNLKKIAEMAEISTFHHHCNRHTFTSIAIRKGIGVYEISLLLRHSSVQITQNYLRSVDLEAMDQAVNKIY